jgi:hypothetical protein
VKSRGLFVTGPLETVRPRDATLRASLTQRAMAALRRAVFDRFGRG